MSLNEMTKEGLTVTTDNNEQNYSSEMALAERQQFFGEVDLADTPMFCGDDRGRGLFIHVFGGVLGVVYNEVIAREITDPNAVTGTFASEASSIVPFILAHGGVPKAGVHSDDVIEHGISFRADVTDGPVGCAYAENRATISQKIVEGADELIALAKQKRPALFPEEQDTTFARSVTQAHGRLLERSFLGSGRQAALEAVHAGALTSVVQGVHSPNSVGIINLVPNTSPDTGAAMDKGLPFYNQDSWALQRVIFNLSLPYPYDEHQQQIIELIDVLGTMKALGIKDEDIIVRRPNSISL